jgi:hypothetical protein
LSQTLRQLIIVGVPIIVAAIIPIVSHIASVVVVPSRMNDTTL